MKKITIVLTLFLLVLSLSSCGSAADKTAETSQNNLDQVQTTPGDREGKTSATDGWVMTCLGKDNGKALYAQLPPEMNAQSDSIWDYSADHIGLKLETSLFSVDSDLAGNNWSDQKPDNTSDLTSGEFLFAMECDDLRNNYVPNLSDPKTKTSSEKINGLNWKTFTVTGKEAISTASISEELHMYCCFKEDISAELYLLYAYDESASREERKTVENWLKTIPKTLQISTEAALEAGPAGSTTGPQTDTDASNASLNQMVSRPPWCYGTYSGYDDNSGGIDTLTFNNSGSILFEVSIYRLTTLQLQGTPQSNEKIRFDDGTAGITGTLTHYSDGMLELRFEKSDFIYISDGDVFRFYQSGSPSSVSSGNAWDGITVYGSTYEEAVAAGWGDKWMSLANETGTEAYYSDGYYDSDPNARLHDFVLNCDKQYYPSYYLDGFDAQMAILARNAPYAHAGREFNNDTIKSYFQQYSWYHPLIEPDAFRDTMLNDYEKANMELVVAYEKEMGYK